MAYADTRTDEERWQAALNGAINDPRQYQDTLERYNRWKYAQSATGVGAGGSGGGSAGGLGRSVAAAGAGTTNTAAPDPNLTAMVDLWKQRLGTLQDPNRLNKQINLVQGNIADSAAGALDASAARSAQRGVLGGGTDQFERNRIDDAARRLSAKAASDVAQANDQQINAFLLGGQGIMEAPARLGLAQQDLGLRQYLGGRAADLADQQGENQRLGTMLGLYSQYSRQPSMPGYYDQYGQTQIPSSYQDGYLTYMG